MTKCDECDNIAKYKFVSIFNIVHFYCSLDCCVKFFGTKEMSMKACYKIEELIENDKKNSYHF